MIRRRIRLWPYKQGSRSARSLADALGGRVLKLEGSKFVARPSDLIINWGASTCPYPCLNKYPEVAQAGNKLEAFRALAEGGVVIPRFATTPADVSWDGTTVVRHKLRGHSGDGIEIVDDKTPLPRAPLYVEYVAKKDEYRLHVVGQSIIAVQRKARDTSVENPNWKVRNHANGFIFVRGGVEAPQPVKEQALLAIQALGLDFGAVDVIWNAKQKRAYVLEVNTAPGLEGQTINDYATAFGQLARQV